MTDGQGDKKKNVANFMRSRLDYGKHEYPANTRTPSLERSNARRHSERDLLELDPSLLSEPTSFCDVENHSPFVSSHLDRISIVSSDDWFQCELTDYILGIRADNAEYYNSGQNEDDYLKAIPQCILNGRDSTSSSLSSRQKLLLPNDVVDIISTQPSAPNSPCSPHHPCTDGHNEIDKFRVPSSHMMAGHHLGGKNTVNSSCQPTKRSNLKTCLNRVICSYDLHDNHRTAYPLPLPPLQDEINIQESYLIKSKLMEDNMQTSTSKISQRNPASSKWLKGKLLGSGSFGKVYRGHNKQTGELCAIKEVEICLDDPRSKECCEQLAQEIALLRILRHPNILHYKDSEMVGGSLYIYLELVSGGSIYRLLQEFGKFSEPVIQRYTLQILQGLQYLHGKSTVHRDIKCANILVDEDGIVKLADFGTAKIVLFYPLKSLVDDSMPPCLNLSAIADDMSPLSFKGSPYWMAPEVIMQSSSGFELAADIWSLGCTVIEMATGKPPWFEYPGYQALCKIMKAHEIPIPSSLSADGQHFVSSCLSRDPSRRPSASELLNHPFVLIDREAR